MALPHALADRLVFRQIRANLGGGLRQAVVGGGTLPDRVDEFFDAAGLSLIDGYGMTEAIVVMALREPGRGVLKTAGTLLPGMELRLLGRDGRRAGPDSRAGSSCAGRTSCAATTKTSNAALRCSAPMAGSTPATSCGRRRTAACASWVAATTRSCWRPART